MATNPGASALAAGIDKVAVSDEAKAWVPLIGGAVLIYMGARYVSNRLNNRASQETAEKVTTLQKGTLSSNIST